MSKRQLYLPPIEEIEANFMYAYEKAGSPSDDFWYNDVYFLCLELALEYRVNHDVIAAVIATLSPLTPWSTNVKNARKMIEFVLTNKKRLFDFFNGRIKNIHIDVLNDITELFAHVQGYNTNKAKALFIALYGDTSWCRGEKVRAFFHNIAEPNSNQVTIDIWMIRMGLWDFTIHIKRNPYTFYSELFRQAIINVSARLGIQPKQLQAIVWKRAQLIGKIMAPIDRDIASYMVAV